jgi:hypothetical protein
VIATSPTEYAYAQAYEAYDYVCYANWRSKADFINNYYYWIYAWARGCFFVPSDGNLYETRGYGGGFADAPLAVIYTRKVYEERGCVGDAFYSVTSIGIDTNNDGVVDEQDYWDYVRAVVVAPPCGAI